MTTRSSLALMPQKKKTYIGILTAGSCKSWMEQNSKWRSVRVEEMRLMRDGLFDMIADLMVNMELTILSSLGTDAISEVITNRKWYRDVDSKNQNNLCL